MIVLSPVKFAYTVESRLSVTVRTGWLTNNLIYNGLICAKNIIYLLLIYHTNSANIIDINLILKREQFYYFCLFLINFYLFSSITLYYCATAKIRQSVFVFYWWFPTFLEYFFYWYDRTPYRNKIMMINLLELLPYVISKQERCNKLKILLHEYKYTKKKF